MNELPSAALGQRDVAGGQVLPPKSAFLRSLHLLSAAVSRVLEEGLLERHGWGQLTPNQLHILRLVDNGADWTVGRVARVLGVSSPAASKILARLEAAGLVRRHSSSEDRREVFIRPTPEGHRAVAEISRLQAQALGEALADDAGPQEVERLRRAIQDLAVRLITTGPRDGESCLACGGYFEAGCEVRAVTGWCPYLGEEPLVEAG